MVTSLEKASRRGRIIGYVLSLQLNTYREPILLEDVEEKFTGTSVPSLTRAGPISLMFNFATIL